MEVIDFIVKNFGLISLPIVSAVVGWGTNKVAIHLTFYPLEYKGIKPWFGWQGIVPARSGVMAERVIDLTVTKLMDIQEQFGKLDSKVIALEMKPRVDFLARQIVDEVATKEIPLMWFTLPKSIKENIYKSAAQELPVVIASMMDEIKNEIHSYLDFKQLLLRELMRDKSLLNRLFLKCGEKEFLFIERSGYYFGFLLGLPLLLLWIYYPLWWLLPLFGLINGYLTNWLAMKLIFEPQKPINLGFYTIQGLFLKRQKEVSVAYAEIMAAEVVSAEKIFEEMLHGPASEKFADLIMKYVCKAVDQGAGTSKKVITLLSGREKYLEIKAIACQRFMEDLPQSIKGVIAYAEKQLDARQTIETKLMALSPIDFTGLLRPIFQEDEWKLIVLGGVLGMVAGFLQLLLM